MTEHTDPVCGMVVMPESAEGKAEYLGKTYYFCSDQCMRVFQNDPGKFAAQPTNSRDR
ncbi:MAG: YHS domain-containing protein [Gemmatimonadaceae bacterium]